MAGNKKNTKRTPKKKSGNYTSEQRERNFANRNETFHRKYAHGEFGSITHIKYQKGNIYFS